MYRPDAPQRQQAPWAGRSCLPTCLLRWNIWCCRWRFESFEEERIGSKLRAPHNFSGVSIAPAEWMRSCEPFGKMCSWDACLFAGKLDLQHFTTRLDRREKQQSNCPAREDLAGGEVIYLTCARGSSVSSHIPALSRVSCRAFGPVQQPIGPEQGLKPRMRQLLVMSCALFPSSGPRLRSLALLLCCPHRMAVCIRSSAAHRTAKAQAPFTAVAARPCRLPTRLELVCVCATRLPLGEPTSDMAC